MTSAQDGTFRYWAVADGTALDVIRHGEGLPSVLGDISQTMTAIHPNGRSVAASSPDGVIRVFSEDKLELILKGHRSAVVWGAFSAEGRYFVTSSDDGTARIWRLTANPGCHSFYPLGVELDSVIDRSTCRAPLIVA